MNDQTRRDIASIAYDAANSALREVNLRIALRKSLPHLERLQEIEPKESIYRVIRLAQVLIEE
jgi:hypothetical protein